jgi:hypothetical protein
MMTRPMRRMVAATVLAAALATAGAEPFDGGGGGGVLSTPGERAALIAQVQEVQAEATLARDLAALYAAVASFADTDAAAAAGYGPASACMTSDRGAQGIHWANGDLMASAAVVADSPQLLMYEPGADGSLRFLGVEYLVFQQAWHDTGHVDRPILFGQTFGLNETLLDEPFYLLHVWVGQFNPSGVFADWNPLVDCGHETAVGH